MKKILMSFMAPVLALLPQAARADEACKVGKQVFVFVPTGEIAYIGETEKNLTESRSVDPYLKIPDIDGESQRATGYLKIGDIKGESSGQAASPYIKMDGVPGESKRATPGVKYDKMQQGGSETRASGGYLKIPDIDGESQRSKVYPKVEMGSPQAMDKATPTLMEYAVAGTKFLKWEPGMLKRGAKSPPLIETTSGDYFLKLDGIDGESVSQRWIDKSSPILALKSTCEE